MTCINCRFFSPVDVSTARDGTCRRFPPVVVNDVSSDDNGTIETDHPSIWPYVTDSAWCGEFKMKATRADRS
jgi:hypothetical protein